MTKKRPPYEELIYSKTPVPLAKQYVTNTKCECGCYVRLDDTSKNELVCPVCGLVHSEQSTLTAKNLVYGSWSKNELYTGNGYTYSEKEFMRKKGIKTRTFTGNSELNKMDYKYLLDVFKYELCLSPTDIQTVFLIIKKCKGLKQIHSKLNYERILLGICRYVLKQKGIRGYLINLNTSIYREYKLSRKDYNIIEKNIEKYRSI